MKKTATNDIEQKLISLFDVSKNEIDKEKAVEAQTTINKILQTFKAISVFDNTNHNEKMILLYFTKENILTIGVRKMAEKLYMDDKTLYNLRKKYCDVIQTIVDSQYIKL